MTKKIIEDIDPEERAARALKESNVFLLVTGAGFSADSGLAVYNDIGKVLAYKLRGLDYSDVCRPQWLHQEPALFYGFWGQCFNDYRDTQPHEGYRILRKWRDDKKNGDIAKEIRSRIQRKYHSRRPFDDKNARLHTPYLVDHETQIAGSFFAYTSNVDAHHYDTFGAEEIHDCHGNIEIWNCSNEDCSSGMWRAPLDYRFAVNKETMLAPETKQQQEEVENPSEDEDNGPAKVGHIKTTGERYNLLKYMPLALDQTGWKDLGSDGNWPRCGHCNSLARPSILMFNDFGSNFRYDLAQDARWETWEEAVMDLVKAKNDDPLKICILEIGCGLNVPTCRNLSEHTVQQVLRRGGNPTLIRINPDYPNAPKQVPRHHVISIRSKGLEALKRIDKIYRSLD